MSGKTTTAIWNSGGYSDELKAHPAGKFISDYAETFDSGDHTASRNFHHPTKATYIKSDGTTHTGQAYFTQIKQDYSFFTKVYHEPGTLLLFDSVEIPGAYEVLGTANIHADLVGERAASGEPERIKDREGKEWDIFIPGAFHFWIEKIAEHESGGHGGLAIVKAAMHSDTGPVMARLVKRGVLKAADIGL